MSERAATQLPRGRHRYTREEVEQHQRVRILVATAEAMGDKGYVNTPVADILRHAGVSRETFYQLYTDKLDSFLAAFDLFGDALVARLQAALDGSGEPLTRLERALTVYLDSLAEQPAYARLFLVEVYAAGAEAMSRRAIIQQRIADGLADLLGADSKASRFACQVLVSAVSAMVTGPLVAGDFDELRRLRRPILDHVRRLHAGGLIGRTTR